VTVYVDVVFIVNLFFDLAILLLVDLLLKRKASYKRIFFGALLGEISMLMLFVKMNSLIELIFKFVLSLLMCLIAFNFKTFKYTIYNILYFYLISIILGGFVQFLYQEFEINNTLSIKYLIIIFLCPIFLYVYYKLSLKIKNNYNNRYIISFDYDCNHFDGVGYLDSGNNLISPINGKPIILVEKEYIKDHKLKLLPIPFNALNHHGLVYCFKPNNLTINGKIFNEVLIGISEIKFNIDGCNTLLNARMENL